MLINVTEDESRIAIVENQTLNELLIEHRTQEQIKGNIYHGVITQIQPSIQAAFVNYGLEKNGFLPYSDLNLNLFPPLRKNSNPNTIQSRLKAGQSLLVQVTRGEIEKKGAALSTNLNLPGRYMVFMPHSNQGGVSKRIEDLEERNRLKNFIVGIESEVNAVIIRTSGIGRDLQELKKDYTSLKRKWNTIENAYNNTKTSGLVYEEEDVIVRTIRDYFTNDIEEIWVDHPDAFQKALHFMKTDVPRKQKIVKLFVGNRSLFSTYSVERQVEQLTSRKIKLQSGGSIVIDPTEALVAIDVNSGKSTQENNLDSTALRTNLEAAQVISRQLKLRNLGGLVVVDFIDMESQDDRKKVEDVLIQAFSEDKAQHTIGEISQFGLLELSRQRMSAGISTTVESNCLACNGKGKIPTTLTSANSILRALRDAAADKLVRQIKAEIPLGVANHLHNNKREILNDLEMEFGIKILLTANPNIKSIHQISYHLIEETVSGVDSSQKKENQIKKPGQKKDVVSGSKDITSADLAETQIFSKQEVKKEVKSQPPIQEESGEGLAVKLHKGCLFGGINELKNQELKEVSDAFFNRIKGALEKLENISIDNKFLWPPAKNHILSTLDITDTAEIEAEEEQNITVNKNQESKKGNPKEKKAAPNVKSSKKEEDKIKSKNPKKKGNAQKEPTLKIKPVSKIDTEIISANKIVSSKKDTSLNKGNKSIESKNKKVSEINSGEFSKEEGVVAQRYFGIGSPIFLAFYLILTESDIPNLVI